MSSSILKSKKIGIIAGGWSGERDEAIVLGKHMKKVLEKNFIKTDLRIVPNNKDLLTMLTNFDVDFTFLETTEEVPVQPILDSLGIAYNGSGNLETALSLNKDYVKRILGSNNIKIAKDVIINKGEKYSLKNISFPCVVKPVDSGSSCGVSLVKSADKLKGALSSAFDHSNQIMIEDYINGKEVTIPVIGNFVLPAVIIDSDLGFWNEEQKCNLKVKFDVIPLSNKNIYKNIQNLVNNVRCSLNLESFWRLDTIYKDGEFYVLEVNTLPCMAGGEVGIIPCSLKEIGWSHYEFLSFVAKEAILRQKLSIRKIIRKLD